MAPGGGYLVTAASADVCGQLSQLMAQQHSRATATSPRRDSATCPRQTSATCRRQISATWRRRAEDSSRRTDQNSETCGYVSWINQGTSAREGRRREEGRKNPAAALTCHVSLGRLSSGCSLIVSPGGERRFDRQAVGKRSVTATRRPLWLGPQCLGTGSSSSSSSPPPPPPPPPLPSSFSTPEVSSLSSTTVLDQTLDTPSSLDTSSSSSSLDTSSSSSLTMKTLTDKVMDKASAVLTQILGGGVAVKGMPVAEGDASTLFEQALVFWLHGRCMELGPVFKLAFGPKAFVVVSDPIVARHVLKENALSYDKGLLSELLEPIMGKGLIPADQETWKKRRRAIVPAFHAAYLEAMMKVFTDCSQRTVDKFESLLQLAEDGQRGRSTTAAGKQNDADDRVEKEVVEVEVEMEREYSSLALDIIGLGIFNYDFGSVKEESPVIQAVYGTLYEVEHRATFYLPYWKLPFADKLVPRQRKFQADLKVINDCLDDLIERARANRQEEDLEALQQRDYSKVEDASLLRFLVDMRGEDCEDKQLRDDLVTILIAGHETTAAVLTWGTYLLAQHPHVVLKAQQEIDRVMGEGERARRRPSLQDLKDMQYVRLVVAETLRLYPQPPQLIRRSIAEDLLPGGHLGNPEGYKIPKGTDFFVMSYSIHRNPHFWDDPENFNPDRFLTQKSGQGIPGWDGLDPQRTPTALYPNEVTSDFAFLPFGGGMRKCVGDQFALMESTVALAMLLQRFDLRLRDPPETVIPVTGATIHTKNGLYCRLRRRQRD
ncbi:hypothetical protein CBR_g55238 [Chara braunii]|uniref:Cytochrome P450 n=1 Tax=Chara braunii TaxID=69332 RepID=A0A388MCR9_CHABU|nr:hypothetical protein CBR_g55238 [Chara braunii]|eukprot:GBG92357.1 hypothetical protein CBR_g55238 [Chara braunii]